MFSSSYNRKVMDRSALSVLLLSAVIGLSFASMESSMDSDGSAQVQLRDLFQEFQGQEDKRTVDLGGSNNFRRGSGETGGLDLSQQSPPFWGSVATSAAQREPSCAELRAMWRHTRRIIRHAAAVSEDDPASPTSGRKLVAGHRLPSFVNTVEYAFAPKFLRFWHAQPRGRGAAGTAAATTTTRMAMTPGTASGGAATPSEALPVGRVLLTKTKSKRPPPNSLSVTLNTEYQVLPGRSSGDKVPRGPGALSASTGDLGALAGGVGYFHEDDEGGELVFQNPSGTLDGLPRGDEAFAGAYGTIVRSPEEKAKLRREFLLSGAALSNDRLASPFSANLNSAKDMNTIYSKDRSFNYYNQNYKPYYRYKSKFEICREKVENAPCRSDADCFCSKSVHPYICHDALGVCTRKGGMQVLRDTYGRWFQRPFDTRELGFNQQESVGRTNSNFNNL